MASSYPGAGGAGQVSGIESSPRKGPEARRRVSLRYWGTAQAAAVQRPVGPGAERGRGGTRRPGPTGPCGLHRGVGSRRHRPLLSVITAGFQMKKTRLGEIYSFAHQTCPAPVCQALCRVLGRQLGAGRLGPLLGSAPPPPVSDRGRTWLCASRGLCCWSHVAASWAWLGMKDAPRNPPPVPHRLLVWQ